jgi:hypothetical protein
MHWWQRVPRWLTVSGLLAILALPSAILQLQPNIEIGLLEPVWQMEPMSSPIIVKNKGMLPVYNVAVKCWLNHVEGLLTVRRKGTEVVLDTPSVIEGIMVETSPDRGLPDFEKISGGDAVTIPCNAVDDYSAPSFPVHRVTDAEIIVQAVYNSPWLPRRRSMLRAKQAGFRLVWREKGTVVSWLPVGDVRLKSSSVKPINPYLDSLYSLPVVPPKITMFLMTADSTSREIPIPRRYMTLDDSMEPTGGKPPTR